MLLTENPLKNYTEQIKTLKKELNAVILAHYYQESEIQDIADFIGDSLELARKAKNTDADVIVFCGVHFMAETAKILNPEKLVLIPDLEAGCSLAESCPADSFKAFREANPDLLAITYINCTAEVKALSDIICTSSNAERIIKQIPSEQKILFSPDKNLGRYLSKITGRDMVLWDGACIVHETFSRQKLMDLKIQYPDAKVLAHPECTEPLLELADYVGSTSKLLSYSQEDSAQQYIVMTEPGIIHQMKKALPNKVFIPALPEENCSCNNCPHMKLNTLQKIAACMEQKQPALEMDETLRLKALQPLEKMLAMS